MTAPEQPPPSSGPSAPLPVAGGPGPAPSEGGRGGAARRHRARLDLLQRRPRARREVLRLLRARHEQAGTADGGGLRIEIEDRGDRAVLRAPGELLAGPELLDRAAARRAVRRAGFVAVPVAPLRGRVLRLRVAPEPRDGRGRGCRRGRRGRPDVHRLQRALGRLGVPTSLVYLTPTRVVMKATASPRGPGAAVPRATPPDGTVPRPGGVRVVVLDTGVAVRGRDDGWLLGVERDGNTDPLDVFPRPNGYLDLSAGHGTFVAGLVQQVDPRLDLRVERVVDSDGVASDVDVACALVRAVERCLEPGGRLVVNLSLGAETLDDRPPLALRAALAVVREIEAERAGQVLVVAAAGNEGGTVPCWPAAFAATDRRVVAVAALATDGGPAPWSTHGPWVTCSAPGEAVLSTFVTGAEDPGLDADAQEFGRNAWAYWTGTSFAAPQVAARVASLATRTGAGLDDALREVLASAPGLDRDYGSLLPGHEGTADGGDGGDGGPAPA